MNKTFSVYYWDAMKVRASYKYQMINKEKAHEFPKGVNSATKIVSERVHVSGSKWKMVFYSFLKSLPWLLNFYKLRREAM